MEGEQFKECTICHITKPLKEFCKKGKGATNYRGSCMKCYQPRHNQKEKNRTNNIKQEVRAAYGNKCACCSESIAVFLTLDHINNNGAEHRKQVGNRVYEDAKKAGFPKDKYQLLCWNCNCGRAINGGVCPHQTVT